MKYKDKLRQFQKVELSRRCYDKLTARPVARLSLLSSFYHESKLV